jgi:methyl-accepting chemotaxis protein
MDDLIMQKLLEMTENISSIKTNQEHMKDTVHEVREDIKSVSQKVDTVDNKVLILDEKFRFMSDKIISIESKKNMFEHVGAFIKDNPKVSVFIFLIILAACGVQLPAIYSLFGTL